MRDEFVAARLRFCFLPPPESLPLFGILARNFASVEFAPFAALPFLRDLLAAFFVVDELADEDLARALDLALDFGALVFVVESMLLIELLLDIFLPPGDAVFGAGYARPTDPNIPPVERWFGIDCLWYPEPPSPVILPEDMLGRVHARKNMATKLEV